jgi:hypothetical protein
MKKIFILLSITLLSAANANAGVSVYKNLYAQLTASPSAAGEVYLEAATDEDASYVKEASDDYGETAYIKVTLQSNGDEGASGGVNDSKPCYLVKAYAEPMDGYELAFYSNVIKEDGIYAPSDCYAVFNQVPSEERTASFEATGMGDIININNVIKHSREDGTSADETPSREGAFNNGIWEETPDAEIYAIFRKVGEELPKIDESLVPDPGTSDDITTDITNWDNAIYVEPVAAVDGEDITLSIRMKNANPITAVEFQVEVADSVGVLDIPLLSTERTSETKTDYFKTSAGNIVKVIAFSHSNSTFDGNDGEIATVKFHVKEGIEAKNYEIKVNNVVMAGLDAVAVKPNETKTALSVSESTGINTVDRKAVNTGKAYRVNGVEIQEKNPSGLIIKNGKTVLVK